ncbi:MAG: hypothetical protein PHT79_06385 [Syntrophomonadaceae bacterium]|nr:hypothetical protein [Syntrophomonadaceae bacterium]MDD3889103.1 hypothetical protein [Syntrophomonadaceae bacterium]MDD4549372.1 hypothetical protein [Syntrophomonadaceae bacterium]
MAIYTPRGLKIRFSVPFSFSLMARMFPDITPFTVLKKTEAIENLSDCLPVITAFIIIFFFPNISAVGICETLIIAWGIGYIMKITGIFFIPFIIPLSEVFSYIHGRGIITIVIGVAGYFKLGFVNTAVMLGILFVMNFIIENIVELLRVSLCRKFGKQYLSVSELDFINAYRMLAASIKINKDIVVSNDEISSEAWKEPYTWLETNYPEITSRYDQYN